MVKVDRQTKIERLKRNVEAVKRAFKKIFAFWGLDKVVVNNLSYFGIDYDEAKITEAKAAHDSVIKLLPNQIFVNDRKHHFCFNAFKKGNPGGKCRWRASMAVLYDGLNVPTSSVADICRRVIEIKGILEDDYGIKIDILNAEYSYMEIAYTLTSANQMPSRVVDLFMGLVSTKTQNITRISPSVMK